MAFQRIKTNHASIEMKLASIENEARHHQNEVHEGSMREHPRIVGTQAIVKTKLVVGRNETRDSRARPSLAPKRSARGSKRSTGRSKRSARASKRSTRASEYNPRERLPSAGTSEPLTILARSSAPGPAAAISLRNQERRSRTSRRTAPEPSPSPSMRTVSAATSYRSQLRVGIAPSICSSASLPQCRSPPPWDRARPARAPGRVGTGRRQNSRHPIAVELRNTAGPGV